MRSQVPVPPRPLLAFFATWLLWITACGGSSSGAENDAVTIETVAPAVIEPTATVSPESLLRGFVYPIVGACLPQSEALMPNAPRPYRDGFHEGIDMYDSDNCTLIGRGTEVVATKAGTVIRADTSYAELTAAELARLRADPNTPEALDRFRGRQVWVDHGNGIVTRYAHLGSIAPGIAAGTRVSAGQVIAFVGESGTPESVEAPGTDNHLHFEVRVGDSFAGDGLSAVEVRRIYVAVFKP